MKTLVRKYIELWSVSEQICYCILFIVMRIN